MEGLSEGLELEKIDITKIEGSLQGMKPKVESSREIELPGYEDDILFSEQSEESTDIEFSAVEGLGEQKHLNYEAITVRLESPLVSRINELRRKTTRKRRERLAGSHRRTERLTNNSFYRSIMNSVIEKLEKTDFSDCETEEHLREKISKLLN